VELNSSLDLEDNATFVSTLVAKGSLEKTWACCSTRKTILSVAINNLVSGWQVGTNGVEACMLQ